MSLLSLGQRVFDGARQLIDGLQKPASGQSREQQGALGRFGSFNLNGNATAMSNETVRSLSAATPIDEPKPAKKGDESFVVRLKKNPPDPKEMTNAIIKQIGYTAPDVEAYKAKHSGAEPRTDIYKIINTCMIDPRCEKIGFENIPQPKKDGAQPSYELTVKYIPRSVTEPLRDFLKTERTAQKAEFEAKLQNLKNNSTGLIAKDTAAQIGEAVKKNVPTVLTTTIAGGLGTAANMVMRPPLELPQISEMVKNMRIVVGSAAALGEFAPPAILGAIGIGGAAATTEQYLSGQAADRLADIATRNRDRILAIPLPPMQMEDASNAPSPRGVPPLQFPPPPLPLPSTVDNAGKVKTVTQTTSPIAPQIATQVPGRSNQPLPPPPPFVSPVQEQKPEDLIFLSKQAAILAKNMEAAGMGVKPAGFAAHHIVPYGDGRQIEYNDARNILNKYGIDLNAATNGVYLPHKSDVYIGGMYHPKIHKEGYAVELLERLTNAEALGTTLTEKKQFVEEALQTISQELMNHTMPIDRKRQ